MEKRVYEQLSTSTRKFLELTTMSSVNDIKRLWIKDLINDACRYIEEAELKYLPLYINHPVLRIQLIVRNRLRGPGERPGKAIS